MAFSQREIPPLTLTSVRNINENKLMDSQHIQLVMHSYCTFLTALFTFNTVVHTLLMQDC